MFSIPTAPSAGTSVAQSASANTFGSYVQMTASTSEADYIVGVRYALTATNQPSYLSVAIGTGGAGSETLVGIVNCVPYGETGNTINGGSAAVINGRGELPYPIPVANATRIACKTATDIASALAWKLWLDCFKQADLVDAGINENGNVTQWNGTNVAAPATAGVPDVNVKNFNNQTAQTDANNLPKVDLEDIAGSAVSTTTAQLGVNVVKYNNQTAATDANNLPKVDVEDYGGAPGTFAGGRPEVNTTKWLGGTIPAVNVTGVPLVDLKYTLGAISPAQAGSVAADWSATTNKTAAANLSGTTINLCNTITTYTGDTPQTGDCFARLGAPAGASIAADLAEIEGETDGIASIPTTTPLTAAQIATGVWQDATAADFTVASSIGKSLYVANIAPGGDGGLVVGGVSQTLKLKQLDIENSTGDAVIFKSTSVNSRGVYVDSTLGPGVVLQSEKTDGIAFHCVAINGVGSVGAQFAGRNYDIYCAQSGSFAADMTGRVLGVTQSLGSFSGVGAQADVEQWKGAAAPANTGDAFARLGAPAGLTIAADLAEIEAETDLIGTNAGDSPNAVTAQAGVTALVARPAGTTNNFSGSLAVTPMQTIKAGGPIQTKKLYAKLNATMAPLVFQAIGINGAAGVFVGPMKFRLYVIGSGTPGNESIIDTITAVLSAGNTLATVQVPKTDNAAITVYGWTLWDTGAGDQPLYEGTYDISDAGPAP